MRIRCYLTLFSLALLAVSARSDQRSDQVRTQLLEQMRALAEQTRLSFVSGGDSPVLVKNHVFRYDDQPRRFIDATMWLWTDGGRPVACQKIEAKYEFNTGEPLWGYCFTSLSPDKLKVGWTGRAYQSTEPGIKFQALPAAPPPAAGNAQRKRQLRELARGFAGRILQNPRTGASSEMRLFATPIFEYSDPDTRQLRGAIFGFETNGTNPDVLVLIEANPEADNPTWRFAPARMTNGGVKLTYRGNNVWEAPFVEPGEGPFANWLFFATPRTPVAGEAQP